jgi:DNA modification methylase
MRPVVASRLDAVLRERHPEAPEDVHFTESVVTAVLTDLSEPGDRVLDPFTGFGTTLRVAQRMGRAAVGVELLEERCRIAREQAPGATVVHGDALSVASLVDGPFDLCVTSPPYRTRENHPEDPLQAYAAEGPSYDGYLDQVAGVFAQVRTLLRPGGYVVVNVANLVVDGRVTTLAWDLARAVGEVVPFVGESFVVWDQRPVEIQADYLLVFKRPGQER